MYFLIVIAILQAGAAAWYLVGGEPIKASLMASYGLGNVLLIFLHE